MNSRSFLVLSSVAVAIGCSDPDPTPAGVDSGVDTSTVDVRSDGPTPDSATCPTVANVAPPVDIRITQASQPQGGTIVAGTYFLTDVRLTPASDGGAPEAGVDGGPVDGGATDASTDAGSVLPTRETMEIVGKELRTATIIGQAPETQTTFTFATQSTSLSLTRTCPTPGNAFSVPYTATPTKLVMFLPLYAFLNVPTELEFTKQ